MTTTLGTLTIGQAPRTDIVPILDTLLPPGTPVRHAGLLDGLTRAQIAQAYAPAPGDALLTSRLADGSGVVLGKPAVGAALPGKLTELADAGCDLILLLCTGTFAHMPEPAGSWLLEPDHIVPPIVAALAGDRQAGIVVPLAEQAASEHEKWRGLARPPIHVTATPYQAGTGELEAAARSARDQGARFLVLDCMGYTERHRRAAHAACGLPTLLSNSLLARAVAELLAT